MKIMRVLFYSQVGGPLASPWGVAYNKVAKINVFAIARELSDCNNARNVLGEDG